MERSIVALPVANEKFGNIEVARVEVSRSGALSPSLPQGQFVEAAEG